ncbi:MAG: hypothetical protein HN509_12400 [Halobacteriovoraceae bacterium]|jgi:hypothetical protein|nr:hypothetical protein [Halobacteriovoraceae bacterium]
MSTFELDRALSNENKEITRRLLLGLFFSLCLHLLTLNLSYLLPSATPGAGKPLPKHIKVEKISRQQLKQYRTVGVKNGKKGYTEKLQKGKILPKKFTRKIVKPRKPRAQRSTTVSPPVKTLSLAALKADTSVSKTIKQIEARSKIKQKKEKEEKVKLSLLSNNAVMQQRQNILKDLAANPDSAQAIQNTGFDIKFEPPEGVSEDELNSMEKIYYSFQRRTFETYVTSFLKTYRTMLLRRPQIKRPLKEKIHVLTGRVIFDKDGNIISIKIIRSSADDDVHDLFEDTLKEMRALPNPPKDLVRKDGQFSIYYQLKING